jgi:hypothetical protein
MRHVLVTTNNEATVVEVANDDAIRTLIGGWMEFVSPRGLPRYTLIVDDEGLMKNKPRNEIASAWYGGLIVGDILVCKVQETEVRGLGEEECEHVMEEAKKCLS